MVEAFDGLRMMTQRAYPWHGQALARLAQETIIDAITTQLRKEARLDERSTPTPLAE
jgi:hypothetical protein